MGTRQFQAGCVTILLVAWCAGHAVADELDSRVRHRLEAANQNLDRAAQRIEAGNLGSARTSIEAAKRELSRLDVYEGRYDRNHPDVVATIQRLAELETRLSSGAAGPSRQDLDGARHYVGELEDLVRQAGGSPFPLGAMGKEAIARVKALFDANPDHPVVGELYERLRKAYKASQGATMDITPEMLGYRKIQQELIDRFEALAVEEWKTLEAEVLASDQLVAKAFPPADPRKVGVASLKGHLVVLEQFAYPDNEFAFFNRQYVYVGAPSRGYYFVELSNRNWSGAYEAVRRYRRAVSGEIPQDVKWTMIGKIVGVTVLVPEAGETKRKNAQMGWLVEPVAIRIPGYTFARFDPESEVGGHFSGEDRLEDVKSALYTVKAIPDNATPEQLFAVYQAAIKEKNIPLFFQCIDPIRKKTPAAMQRAQYHWDLHQKRFAQTYVQSVVDRVDIRVAKGVDVDADEAAWLLTEEEREEMRKRSGPLLERATVWLKAFDERGRQVGRPHPLYMRRYDKKQWVVEDASWPL